MFSASHEQTEKALFIRKQHFRNSMVQFWCHWHRWFWLDHKSPIQFVHPPMLRPGLVRGLHRMSFSSSGIMLVGWFPAPGCVWFFSITSSAVDRSNHATGHTIKIVILFGVFVRFMNKNSKGYTIIFHLQAALTKHRINACRRFVYRLIRWTNESSGPDSGPSHLSYRNWSSRDHDGNRALFFGNIVFCLGETIGRTPSMSLVLQHVATSVLFCHLWSSQGGLLFAHLAHQPVQSFHSRSCPSTSNVAFECFMVGWCT